MSKLDGLYVNMQSKMARVKEGIRDFFTSEKGVSNVVATIIILLIVVLLIVVFWDRLQVWVNDMMNTIFGTEIKADKLDK